MEVGTRFKEPRRARPCARRVRAAARGADAGLFVTLQPCHNRGIAVTSEPRLARCSRRAAAAPRSLTRGARCLRGGAPAALTGGSHWRWGGFGA